MSESRSRHIPADVVRKLRLAARDRCCLRGHLIPEDELNNAVESDTLHLHHIVYFCEEGSNSEENLMLVCPSCHAKVHSQPERYPREILREAKRHWIRMGDLVPGELDFEGDNDESKWAPAELALRFRVESFNLPFIIHAPSTITFGNLSRFIGNWILRPLAYYTRTAPFPSIFTRAHIGPVRLAAKTRPDAIFPADTLLQEVPELAKVELISLVDIRMVAAMKGQTEELPVTHTVTLRWEQKPIALSLHIFSGSSLRERFLSHEWRSHLRRCDLTRGHDPETLSVRLRVKEPYAVAVHNLSEAIPLAGCGAILEVAVGDTVRTFRCPEEGEGSWWSVFEFDPESHMLIATERIAKPIEWRQTASLVELFKLGTID